MSRTPPSAPSISPSGCGPSVTPTARRGSTRSPMRPAITWAERRPSTRPSRSADYRDFPARQAGHAGGEEGSAARNRPPRQPPSRRAGWRIFRAPGRKRLARYHAHAPARGNGCSFAPCLSRLARSLHGSAEGVMIGGAVFLMKGVSDGAPASWCSGGGRSSFRH
jgi:hypothetical protein